MRLVNDSKLSLLYLVLSHAGALGNVLKLVLVGVITSVVAVLFDKGKSSY